MYAVIATGGKQYRVEPGTVLRIEKLAGDPGARVEFDQVLLLGDGEKITVGAPLVQGGKVIATIESHGKGKKVDIIKFRRRKHYMRHKGHRQLYTQIKVTDITAA